MLVEGGASAQTLVALLEMRATAAFGGRHKGGARLAALTVDREDRLAQRAHSLLAIQIYIILAINMFHVVCCVTINRPRSIVARGKIPKIVKEL